MNPRLLEFSASRQQGVVLLIGLVMLVIMTLVAVVAIRLTTASLQVVGNSQLEQEAVAAGQKAIENLISKPIDGTKQPADQFIDVNMDGKNDFKVVFAAPICKAYKAVDTTSAGLPKECYGSSSGGSGTLSLCYWTVWEIVATVTDIGIGSGTTATVNQGVRTIAGLDSALVACLPPPP
jgi:Tfp pilus assembly protein PilX